MANCLSDDADSSVRTLSATAVSKVGPLRSCANPCSPVLCALSASCSSGASSGGPSDDDASSQHPHSPLSPKELREQSYQRQIQSWVREEQQYLLHPDWCEQRVIILLQEAFRDGCNRVRRLLTEGYINADEFANRYEQLKSALQSVKSEYRRTLQRLRDSNASKEELMSLSSKAVTCVASVFPWSSSGFSMSYDENSTFAELLSPARADRPVSAPGAASTSLLRASVQPSTSGKPGPRPALQPLPSRKDSFTRSVAADGSVVLSRAPGAMVGSQVASVSAQVYSPPPVVVACSGCTNASFVSPITTPGSPPRQLPLSVTGPIRPEEMRYFERKQMVQTTHSFYARSLAALPFIGQRRSAIAAQRTRRRLLDSSARDGLMACRPAKAVLPPSAAPSLTADILTGAHKAGSFVSGGSIPDARAV